MGTRVTSRGWAFQQGAQCQTGHCAARLAGGHVQDVPYVWSENTEQRVHTLPVPLVQPSVTVTDNAIWASVNKTSSCMRFVATSIIDSGNRKIFHLTRRQNYCEESLTVEDTRRCRSVWIHGTLRSSFPTIAEVKESISPPC